MKFQILFECIVCLLTHFPFLFFYWLGDLITYFQEILKNTFPFIILESIKLSFYQTEHIAIFLFFKISFIEICKHLFNVVDCLFVIY